MKEKARAAGFSVRIYFVTLFRRVKLILFPYISINTVAVNKVLVIRLSSTE